MKSRIERGSGARSVARKLAMQALYRWQLNSCEWQDLVQEFARDPDMVRADAEYFQSLISAICGQRLELDSALSPLLDRKPAELDPIEHALLLIGSYELQHRPDVPFRVVINEAVSLARRFGATDGHKFVNGVLDRGSRLWRPQEH
ncbi:MAG TPA: transcription antitermination factor NusB [Steroidobacteraceae bacterium]